MQNKTAKKKSVDGSAADVRLEEVTEKWKLALADYTNLQKRTEEEKAVLVLLLTRQILQTFLPLYDSLKRAQEVSLDEGNKALLSQIVEIFKHFGVKRMEAKGHVFDPEKHEALEVVSTGEDNKVMEIMRDGFLLNGEIVLRPAQVKVSKPVDKKERSKNV